MNFETLAQTLDCGQCFRWSRLPDGSWEGVAGGRYVRLAGESLSRTLRDPFWARYFDLDRDYAGIRAQLSGLDPALAEAARFAPEIRILNQEPWEALCSFILSQCNNIGRIRGLVARLCRLYGEPIGGGHSAFPAPQALAALREEDLRAAGCGFRAPYVLDAAQKVASGELDLEKIQSLPLGSARAGLMCIRGVGPKVADCALLYGMHRLEAFPMDVWMKRTMRRMFPGKKPSWFGPYAGIAQQYLFHYSRNHPELFR
jgi:N-glycosylase/DNA lyase